MSKIMIERPASVVAIEEHYWDPELVAHPGGGSAAVKGIMVDRLLDFGGDRLRDMDEAGVDIAVLSHGAPSSQRIAAPDAVPLVTRVNDRLRAAISANPSRFAGFCALPTAVPEAAADELERCTGLGFKGAMIHGLAQGEFLDLPKYRPIFARAEQLDVPIYLHPALPHPAVLDAYYRDYTERFPLVVGPGWGFTVETATQAIRLILSGIFDELPRLKIILGHLGETLPYQIWRIDSALARPGGDQVAVREIFNRNFWVTTSGFFSTTALQCCLMEMGADRVLFAVDWPFVADSAPATRWLHDAPVAGADKRKIFGDNARALLKL